MAEAWRRDGATVAAELGTDVSIGLSSAEVSSRRALHGPNRLEAAVVVPAWRKFLDQFADPLIYLLIGAVVASFAAWLLEGAEETTFEGIANLASPLPKPVRGCVREGRHQSRGTPRHSK